MVFINDLSPELVDLGPLSVHYYGLFFAVGVILNYVIARWAFKREKYPLDHLDSVAIYLFLGLVIGARLGHVLFYNFGYFWENPLDFFKIWEGGLASHGAVIGLFVSYFIWLKVRKVKFSKYADVLLLGFPVVATLVRIGNFFNSEIIGTRTENFGVVFKRLGEDFPRHPAQLYEAVLSLVIFGILMLIYLKYYKKVPALFMMFLYIIIYFVGRFLIEFVKVRHIIPEEFPLSMGQILSILPIIAAVVYFIFFFPKQKKRMD